MKTIHQNIVENTKFLNKIGFKELRPTSQKPTVILINNINNTFWLTTAKSVEYAKKIHNLKNTIV